MLSLCWYFAFYVSYSVHTVFSLVGNNGFWLACQVVGNMPRVDLLFRHGETSICRSRQNFANQIGEKRVREHIICHMMICSLEVVSTFASIVQYYSVCASLPVIYFPNKLIKKKLTPSFVHSCLMWQNLPFDRN